jgi:DNA end-binding protein Ku
MLQPRDGMFVVSTLRWPDQVRPADVKIPQVQPPRPQEVKMAAQLVKSMTRPFDPAAHTDEHRQRLVDLVTAKQAGAPVPAVKPKDPAKPYADMMDLLQQSIAAHKQATKKPARRGAPAETAQAS